MIACERIIRWLKTVSYMWDFLFLKASRPSVLNCRLLIAMRGKLLIAAKMIIATPPIAIFGLFFDAIIVAIIITEKQ